MAVERWGMLTFLVMGLLLQSGSVVNADNWYQVGGSNGWTFPPNGIATFFNDWAKEYTFHVGDSLFFLYEYHTVLQVSEADVSTCTTSSPIVSYTSTANATVQLTEEGYYGFICGLPSHCVANMKLELTVYAVGQVGAPGLAPAPGSAPSSAPTSATTPNSTTPVASGPDGAIAPSTSHPGGGASGIRALPALVMGALVAGCTFLL